MSELQTAIDRARDDAVSKLFAEIVVRLQCRATEAAVAESFGDGLDAILQAHKIATKAAEDVEKG